MAAQGHDAATGTAHVAQQQLQNAGRPNDLRAVALLRPADRVANRGRALAAGVLRQDLRNLEKLLSRRAADALHHFRRVAGEMPLDDLEDTSRMLQRFIAVRPVLRRAGALLAVAAVRGRIFRTLDRGALVVPAAVVVFLALGVKPGKQAVALLGVDVLLIDDAG